MKREVYGVKGTGRNAGHRAHSKGGIDGGRGYRGMGISPILGKGLRGDFQRGVRSEVSQLYAGEGGAQDNSALIVEALPK